MLAVSLVVVTGFATSYRQVTYSSDAVTRDLASGAVVRPGDAPAATLAGRLTMFPSAGERLFAAEAIDRFAREHGRLTHVGALAAVTVPAATVQGDPRLTVLRDRLAQQRDPSPVRLLTSADIITLKPALIVRTPGEYRRDTWTAFALFLAAFWCAHAIRRWLGTTGDAVLLPAVQLLAGLGVIAMVSLRDPLRDTEAAVAMANGVALACAVLVGVSSVDFESPRFRFAKTGPLAVAVGLAVLLLAFGSGPSGSGVKVNLWGGQPIELIRLVAVLALAAFFSRRWEAIRELSDHRVRVSFARVPRWADAQPLVVIVGTLLAFFFLQRDLGPALVLGCLSLALYGVARARAGLVIVGFVVLLAGFFVGYEAGMPATVAKRVAIWVDPWENGLRGGDQVAHGLWSLASGGVQGIGLGAGDGQLVPAGHTDLIVAVVGEEVGLVGVVLVAVLYVLLVWRMLHVAARAPGDYTAFLALGCALSLAVPALVVIGGVFGALPLSGVVTPFLSFGKSSMMANVTAVAIVLAIARRAGRIRPHFRRQVRTVGAVLGSAAAFLVLDAVRIQAWSADALAVRPTLVEHGDGVARYQYNPRLLNAARSIPRGTIFDRNGLVLATGSPETAATTLARLRAAGVAVRPCPPTPERCYPLGGRAFHLIGDWNHQTNWNAPNASFLERDENATLQGFDDSPRVVARRTRGGATAPAVIRDYRELMPLVRHKQDPDAAAVRRLLGRSRDVTSSVDAMFQALVADALAARVRDAAAQRGAVVVVDPDTGELLASASVPYPEPDLDVRVSGRATPGRSLLDRARYGLYPPGSTFKLVTAAAALRVNAQSSRFTCRRLEDGRAGARVPGFTHPARDDVKDHPHGDIGLHDAMVVSCNAYFAQLAVRVGPVAMQDAAEAAGLQVAREPAATRLPGTLPYAGYGQGEVLASPLRMARVAGAIATDGVIRQTLALRAGTRARPAPGRPSDVRWLTPGQASSLAPMLRQAVSQGTGRVLAAHRPAIAGKTGTAEVSGAPSHAWFVGFAPYATRGRRIAFAVLIENAGYGGRIAAPLAGDVVTAAQATGLIK